jgi:hypothetical protein
MTFNLYTPQILVCFSLFLLQTLAYVGKNANVGLFISPRKFCYWQKNFFFKKKLVVIMPQELVDRDENS